MADDFMGPKITISGVKSTMGNPDFYFVKYYYPVKYKAAQTGIIKEPVGKRLAIFYDAPGGNSKDHMKRHIGRAWLDLPLSVE